MHTAWEDFILVLSVLYFFYFLFYYEICENSEDRDDLFPLLASFLWLEDVRSPRLLDL